MIALLFIVLPLVIIAWKILTSTQYVNTPFACMRKDYFDKTGLTDKLPRGRWKW